MIVGMGRDPRRRAPIGQDKAAAISRLVTAVSESGPDASAEPKDAAVGRRWPVTHAFILSFEYLGLFCAKRHCTKRWEAGKN